MLSVTNLLQLLFLGSEQQYEQYADSNLAQNLSIGLGIGGGCGEQGDEMIRKLLFCFGSFIKDTGQGFNERIVEKDTWRFKESQPDLLRIVEEKVEFEGGMAELEAHAFNNPYLKGDGVYYNRNIRKDALKWKKNILNQFNYTKYGQNKNQLDNGWDDW
ncbi:MAG: hypothetical protein EZS28_018903 [Streblomastix strix]|uniref:Uncharacterized protein n=1 Tax=Streblomastix strix TaxID=222440 RepID=A0A5J4VT30_9EUKA|nr:MAG: hypothetical protein EZS28_018903 [Streblomastix strix]